MNTQENTELVVTTKNDQLKEQLLKDIKELQFHIDYHEKHLSEYKLKMQLAEYTLRNLTESEYAV